MRIIEQRTLEEEGDRWKRAIKAEEEVIAAGNLSFAEISANDGDPSISRREHLLELQSRLAVIESRLASEELGVGTE